jgi:hypothetical protein
LRLCVKTKRSIAQQAKNEHKQTVRSARMRRTFLSFIAWTAALGLCLVLQPRLCAVDPYPLPLGTPTADDLYRQTDADVLRKSWGCVNCHQGVTDMHDMPTVKLGCTDCHGGDADMSTKEAAHVKPRLPQGWPPRPTRFVPTRC